MDFSLPEERVIRSQNQIIEWQGKPSIIRMDNKPEYVSGKLMGGLKTIMGIGGMTDHSKSVRSNRVILSFCPREQ